MPFPRKYRSRAIFQIRYALLALIGAILFGTIGFKLIEGWSIGDSFYVTVQTLTTVGYGDIPPQNPAGRAFAVVEGAASRVLRDRKSTRLNSSHDQISYAVFCLKKKKKAKTQIVLYTSYKC